MLSLEKCNEILNQKIKKYSIEQVKDIREKLYQLTEIMMESKISNDE